jgi:hypothetical protein
VCSVRLSSLAVALVALVLGGPASAWSPASFFAPCTGECGVAIYGGNYVEDGMGEVLVNNPQLPTNWRYANDDHIIATAISREMWTILRRWHLEPEVGIAQRFGQQNATEVWGGLFFRYKGFPWDNVVVTTAAFSLGLNYASKVTDVEESQANEGQSGSRLMHYFAPEITFASPRHPNLELLFRFHHRSGLFGIVGDSFGGAQYGTVGVRVRF